MPVNLEEKSLELKKIVSQYDTKIFLGDLSTLMKMITSKTPYNSLEGLSSPQRQLFYLAGLHLNSEHPDGLELKYQYTEEEWEVIKSLLIEIEKGYGEMFFPNDSEEIDELWIKQRKVAMPAFLNYFNQGALNFEEQVIERIQNYFEKFNTEIKSHFNLTVSDFIDIYNFIDELLHQKLNDFIVKKDDEPTWEEFCDSMQKKGIMNPQDWNDHLPDNFKNLFENVFDSGKKQRFTLEELSDSFGEVKAKAFVNALVCERSDSQFKYYTEENKIYSTPVFIVDDNEYQSIDIKQIIHAIYNLLFSFVKSIHGGADRFYKIRGQKLEDKIVSVFKKTLGKSAIIYEGFYTDDGNEQDILILYKGLALIIEAKASKRDEPRRDPDKAYPLIVSNFNETIQKGYDQGYRVKKRFLSNEVLNIYSDIKLNNKIASINTKKYHNAFTLIVTLESFGQMQTDLSELLTIEDNDEYPLSICIDDLEVFLLALKKRGFKIRDLIHYLDMREYFHGGLICADELEMSGGILLGKIDMKIAESDQDVITTPDLAIIFDELYEKGLGFENEKNLDRKTSDKFMKFGF